MRMFLLYVWHQCVRLIPLGITCKSLHLKDLVVSVMLYCYAFYHTIRVYWFI